jgi:hypothetical protein
MGKYNEREDNVYLIIQEGFFMSLQVGEGNPFETAMGRTSYRS